MMRFKTFALAAVPMAVAVSSASAQGLDCTRARSAIEKAICASPSLYDQDAALTRAYVDRLARDSGAAPALRAEQRAWLGQRERLCGAPNTPEPRIIACLAGLYRTRLLALSGPTPPVAATPPQPPTRQGQAVPPAPPPAPVQAATPTPVIAAQVLPEAPATPPPSLPRTAPAPEAALNRSTVPALGGGALLEVGVPGRFAIRADSKTGVALQLVDMIEGPGDEVGQPGVKDGRVDALLDRGTYKLRVTGDPKASGEAQLKVEPFREAGEMSAALAYGGESSAELADLGQRSYWISVPKPGRVSVEAVGRSLADLRLWRNGRDLAELGPKIDRVTPKSGHPLTRARIEGEVEPGLYLVTAYGGPPLVWADSDASRPFHLRSGPPETLAGGWVEGTIGPRGSVRFQAPEGATYVRLELPEPAAAIMTVTRGSDEPQRVVIDKTSREPVASLAIGRGEPAMIEVSGAEDQPFRLRTLDTTASRRISGSGPHWLSVELAGEGGDEFPATVLLAKMESGKGARILASSAPQIGPGRAWRQRANLRGSSSILFEVTGAMPTAVTMAGPKATAAITPLLGNAPPRADGRSPGRWDLEPGWYVLKIDPVAHASGILDVTLGPPGLAAEAPKPAPARPSIPLGIQNLERGGNYQIFTNATPSLLLAPVARPLPADLGTAPLTVYQLAGQVVEVPARMPPGGLLAARSVDGIPVPVALASEAPLPKGRRVTIRIPAPERPRAITLSWSDPATRAGEAPRLPAPEETETVTAGQPLFFDLGRDEQKSFALQVPAGGLYRVETLGRLSTRLALATSFVPSLDKAKANGAGQNALAQPYLRAGRYQVLVKSSESAGRLGLSARPAELETATGLSPGASTRASLGDGHGAIVPIEIADAGSYRLELFSLGGAVRARLEDAEGWPLTKPGPVTTIERRFEPGRYRLVVLPRPVESRVVARLSPRIAPPAPLAGHGPHPLPFDSDQSFQWREPAAANEERSADLWTFALKGPADVTLDLTPGMTGELFREGEAQPVARVVAKAGFAGRLTAGRYRLEARSLGRDDRLDYRVSLKSKEIQPGAPRALELPATVPFALAEERVASLTTFGRLDVRGTLKDSEGHVVERLQGRTSDWNIGLSRQLTAGSYTLELAAIPRPEAKKEPASDESASEESEPSDSADAGGTEQGEAAEESAENEPALDNAPDTPTDTPAASTEDEDETSIEVDDKTIEIRFDLPDAVEHPALALDGTAQADGAGVHQFTLPGVVQGGLIAAAARSASEMVLSLERGGPAGHWDVVAFARGTAPLVAAPADAEDRPWRLSAWTVDGGAARIGLAVREVRRQPAGAGTIALEPVPFGVIAPDVRAALVAAPSSGVLKLDGSTTAGLLEGSVAGQGLAPLSGDLLVPQAGAVWLLSRGPAASIAAHPAPAPSKDLALTVPAGGRATWPRETVPSGKVRVWRATSTLGQPGLGAGKLMGAASGSALALAGNEPLRVWNAGGNESLAVRVAASDLALAPEADVGTDYAAALPARSARRLKLPSGRKRLLVSLAPGAAAILGEDTAAPVTIWTGDAAVSRTLDGEWVSVLIVNPSDAAKPVSVSLAPIAGDPLALRAGGIVKRFFGSAGSLSMPADAQAGDRLVAVGADATVIGRDGRVARGHSVALPGPGEIVLDHGPGLVAAWIERPGLSPWPVPLAVSTTLPSAVALTSQAMAIRLSPTAPALLHARTSAPVILGLTQGGQAGEPVAYPAGAEFHRLLAPGNAMLRLYAAQDGPLSGSLELTASPVTPAREGLGDTVALAPGNSALFGFEVKRAGPVGIGVRAEPDEAAVRLLDASGRSLGSGIAQLHRLEPGRYVLEASVPAGGRTTMLRPAIVGIEPPAAGPPPEIVQQYLQMVGLKPTPAR